MQRQKSRLSMPAIIFVLIKKYLYYGNRHDPTDMNEDFLCRLYKFYYSNPWYWTVWLADVALLLLPCFERPAFFPDIPQWVALLIEIVALAILATTFLISVRFQDRKRLFREAIHPYMFIVILIVNIPMNLFVSTILIGQL